MTLQATTVDQALTAFRRLMAALHGARTRQGADPWGTCPMTMPQLRALSLIAASSHGLSGRELSQLLGVGASAITPLVDRLVEHGFVVRHEDEHDRRIARLYATETGSAVLEQLVAGKGDVLRAALENLTPDELQVVTNALDLLGAAVIRHERDY